MKISIITINRNNAEGLKKTIESVAGQTEHPFEFIVIDGASTDGSTGIIHASAHVTSTWISEPDAGIYNAMNKGVAKAHGEWCLFLNSGDCFSSPNVVRQLSLCGATADIVCGNAIILEEPPRRKTPPEEITLDFLFHGSLCHQSALIRRSLLLQHPYDESLKIVSDRKFFLQTLIFDNCSYETVDIDIADYDISGFSATHRFASEQEYTRVLEELLPLRIRQDYGRKHSGSLYGDSPYEKLFLEIGRRNWRKPVYRLVRGLLRILSPFVKSARFVWEY